MLDGLSMVVVVVVVVVAVVVVVVLYLFHCLSGDHILPGRRADLLAAGKQH